MKEKERGGHGGGSSGSNGKNESGGGEGGGAGVLFLPFNLFNLFLTAKSTLGGPGVFFTRSLAHSFFTTKFYIPT